MKLSIIVTTYNIENYLEQCLDSICQQTLSDIEVIVVDDASKDNTTKIIKSYKNKDSRIKTVFFDKNTIGGVASAANAGIEIASGEYIGFADGDDWYEKDMFGKLYDHAKQLDADVCFCNYLEFDEADQKLKNPSDARRWLNISGYQDTATGTKQFKKLLLRFNPVPWRKIYRKSWLNKNHIRFPVGDYFFEDNPFHWETTVRSRKIAFVDYVGCYHRMNRPGQTMSSNNDSVLKFYSHHKNIFEILERTKSLEDYQFQFASWLIGNSIWIGQKLNQESRHKQYNILKSCLELHEKSILIDLSKGSLLGQRGSQLLTSLINDDYNLFEATLYQVKKQNKNNGNISFLYKETRHSLKTDGIYKTISKIKKFLEMKFGFDVPKLFVSNKHLLQEIKSLNRKISRLEDEVKLLKAAQLLDKH
ncbi:MAG: glycosyltransferase family 2 protein [Cellvibrionales bacterium]|nr:glycosyltransferase family 2 protein [Cellvibrionales bacterium]